MQGDLNLWPFPCEFLGLSLGHSDRLPRTDPNQELWAPPPALVGPTTMCLRANLGLPCGLSASWAHPCLGDSLIPAHPPLNCPQTQLAEDPRTPEGPELESYPNLGSVPSLHIRPQQKGDTLISRGYLLSPS